MPGKSVAEKLLIKPESAVWLSHREHSGRVDPLPVGVRVAASMQQADVAIVFADDAASLRTILVRERAQLAKPAAFWVAYPKANRTDVNRDTLWPILSEYGMRPISQVALDDVWSALRFRALKDGEPPFTGGR